jgi:hypothetical protein
MMYKKVTMGIDKKKIKKIVLASQKKVDKNQENIQKILDALAVACKEEGFSGALVTDESSISDFLFSYTDKQEEKILKKISKILNVPVKSSDYLVAICKKLS